MILFLRFLRNNLFHCLLFFFVFAMLFEASSFGAVLNPFPTRDRAPQYQQSFPGFRQAQPPPELEQFRRDIDKFPCPELKALQVRLRNQYNAAVTTTDKEYYRLFLNELYREMNDKNCNH